MSYNMNYIKGDVYYVKEIAPSDAKRMVIQYHYSHKVVNTSSLHLGVFNYDKDLVGVLQYGRSTNGEVTFNKISDNKNCLELNRMVMRDEEPRNSESMAISLCNKYLKKFTNTDWVLSFSDGKESNVGYIYQATNWNYIGYTVSDSFFELDTTVVHNITVWNRYKEKHKDRDTKTETEILYDNFNTVTKIWSKQHIYVLPLRKYIKFKFENKPYPKKDLEIPIIKRKIFKQDGIVLTPPVVEVYLTEKLIPIF